tara:strand:- start:381 stop:566 length:186 start_codon:yes stop_codon:yes gene_type:complete
LLASVKITFEFSFEVEIGVVLAVVEEEDDGEWTGAVNKAYAASFIDFLTTRASEIQTLEEG